MALRSLKVYVPMQPRTTSIFFGWKIHEATSPLARVYSISLKYSAPELANATVKLLQENKIKESCYIRPLTFVGLHGIDLNVTKDSPTHTVIITFPFAKYFKGEGIMACVSSWRRIHDSVTPPLC